MSPLAWSAVALLGGLAACARVAVASLVHSPLARRLALGTLLVNASGSLLLGLLVGAAARGELLVLSGTATLGSYTTFSTWMLDSRRLAERDARAALANLLVSLLVGLLAVALGRAIGGLA